MTSRFLRAQAAAVLVGIPLETGQKQYSTDYKLETYLKIARLFLEDDDPIQAEAYINRASLLQGAFKRMYVCEFSSSPRLVSKLTDGFAMSLPGSRVEERRTSDPV